MIRLFKTALVLAALGANACSSQSCPAVPLHCTCGGDPVCTNGQWVCTCADAGDASSD